MGFKNKRNGRNAQADIQAQKREFEALLSKKLPEKIEMIAQNLVDESFQSEQYQDGASSKWKGRKNDKEGGKKRSSRRGLLIKSGDLISSVEAERRGVDVIIASDLIYAQIHNEGLEGNAFGKHAFKMPKRQFMPIPGESLPDKTEKEIEDYIDSQMDKIFN